MAPENCTKTSEKDSSVPSPIEKLQLPVKIIILNPNEPKFGDFSNIPEEENPHTLLNPKNSLPPKVVDNFQALQDRSWVKLPNWNISSIALK